MVNIKLVDKLYKIAMVQDGIESERDIIHAFAELIVRECAEIADTAEPFLSSDLIKQHFGVEE
jgi:hypothetical protein